MAIKNKFKRLAIISDCVHMFDEAGNVVTENHIYARQIQELASLFEHTIICCPFDDYTKDNVAIAYTLSTITFIPLPNVGGNALKDKFALLKTIPKWIRAFHKANAGADIVYMRFPNNLSIPGFFYFFFKKAKTFAQYTGTWKNYKGEPVTYRFQKWLLKNYFKGPVWIYTDQSKLEGRFFKGYSPSYTLQDWEEETPQVRQRIANLKKEKKFDPVFISVGALDANKNQQLILEAWKLLVEKGFSFYLYIVGEGSLMNSYRQFIEKNKLHEHITLTGKKTHTALRKLYGKVDFIVQAPLAEGYGKVPIEGFFHGVIPLLSDLAVAKEMTGNNERGFIFSTGDAHNLVTLIINVLNQPEVLPAMIENGRRYAKKLTIENWANNYCETIDQYFE